MGYGEKIRLRRILRDETNGYLDLNHASNRQALTTDPIANEALMERQRLVTRIRCLGLTTTDALAPHRAIAP